MSALLRIVRIAQEIPHLVMVQRGIVCIAGTDLRSPDFFLLAHDKQASGVLSDISSRYNNAQEEIWKRIANIENECTANGIFPSYFGANESFALDLSYNTSNAYRHALLGAEAYWQLAEWDSVQADNFALRESIRAANKNSIYVRELAWEEIATNDTLKTQYQNVRQAWLLAKRLPPLGFVAHTDIFSQCALAAARTTNRRLFGAWRGQTLLGYVSAYQRFPTEAPTRAHSTEGRNNSATTPPTWYFDQCIRAPSAPKGTMEVLIDTAMRTLSHPLNCQKTVSAPSPGLVTLGLMPLCSNAQSLLPPDLRAYRVEQFFRYGAIYCSRFYNAVGLAHFKQKFRPTFTAPLYLSYHASTPLWQLMPALLEGFCAMRWWNVLRYALHPTP